MFRALLLVIAFSCSGFAVAQPSYLEGKDYQVIAGVTSVTSATAGQILVKEFFSYGCPWCFELEEQLSQWRQTLPKQVVFKRIPVIFEKGWDVYAKAYYAADALGLEKKFTPLLFKAVQEQNLPLDNPSKMISFFVEHGVDEAVAHSALTSSPSINAKLKMGMQEMQALRVFAVPCLVINDTYKVDLKMVNGDPEKLFEVARFLIEKIRPASGKDAV